jgi:hypothetical protein
MYSFRNFRSENSRKNLELAPTPYFFELLKGCSKNTNYRHSYGVKLKLFTTATGYTKYPFVTPSFSPCSPSSSEERSLPPPVSCETLVPGPLKDIADGLLSQAEWILLKMISLPVYCGVIFYKSSSISLLLN